MTRKTSMKPLAVAMGAAFVTTLSATPMANAANNPFAMAELSGGYMVAENAPAEGKCGGMKKPEEGKCGGMKKPAEGKCGEGKCGEKRMMHEGKCGEGKCGEKMKQEGKCGAEKMKEMEGKCGAGKKSAE